jgi:ubiquinone/menaquinone biosynthesis C-methylase UbiE
MVEVVRLRLSEKSNKNELHYREDVQPQEEAFSSIDKWISRIDDGRRAYLKKIINKVKFYGDVLEVGAGSCWFGSELSKLDSVRKVYCLDFSEKIITNVSPKIIDYLGADKDKMVLVMGDFYNLDFKEKFDMVVVDAALHHIEDMDSVMGEMRKVLKEDGVIVAIREPVLPILRKGAKKKFGLHERSLGVTENIFTKEEWGDFFKRNGFELELIPVIPEYSFKYKMINKFPFRYLNGWLFGHYVFVARKMK